MDVNTYLVESECEWNCNVSLITMKTKELKWTIVGDYLIESIDSSLYSITIHSIEAFQTQDKWYKKYFKLEIKLEK